MPSHLVGLDLGGTRIRAAVTDEDGRIVSRSEALTEAAEGPAAVIRRIEQTIRRAVGSLPWAEVAGIGVGAPGPLDPYAGVVVHAPNLPGWDDVPLRDMLASTFGVAVAIGNDANLAALGEHAYGAGRGVSDMVYMTISTGIGGGIISGGELLLGHRGFAGEIGHQTILVDGPLCGCGNRGCLEALAAGPAIARLAREVAAGRPDTLMRTLVKGDLARISAKVVSAAAAEGDEAAIAVVRQAGAYIGVGLANLANTLNPELFVLGGGVTNIGPLLFDAIQEAFARSAMLASRYARIVPAALGDDVVLWGAIALVRRLLDRTAQPCQT
jgi:glucokinase